MAYLYLDGSLGTFVSTPDAAPLDIVGDIDLRVRVALDDWTPAATTTIFGKYVATGDQRSYWFRVETSGVLRLLWSEDGTVTTQRIADSTAATGFTNGTINWIRVTLDVNGGAGGEGRVQFLTSADGTTWSQLGDNVDTGSAPTLIYASTTRFDIGGAANSALLAGGLYQAQVYSGIAGTLELDVDFTDLTTSEVDAASFTEDSSNAATMTIDGTGSTYFWDTFNLPLLGLG